MDSTQLFRESIMHSSIDRSKQCTTAAVYWGKDYGVYLSEEKRKKNIFSSLAHSGHNMLIEKLIITARPSKEPLRDFSLSKVPSCKEDLQHVQTDILNSVYSTFGIEPLHNIQLGISKILMECTSAYLLSDAIRSRSGSLVHWRVPLIGIWALILPVSNSIFPVVNKYCQWPGL